MKTLATILAIFFAFIIGVNIGIKSSHLEIYTKDNIYYIDGLTVTNEANSAVKKFENKEELKEYISNLTAKQWEQE